MDFKSFNFVKLKKYFGSRSFADLNYFLENLPNNAGKTVLMAAAIVWGAAAVAGLYTTIQAQKLTQMRAEFKETEALKPSVPIISNVTIPAAELQKFIAQAQNSYQDIHLKANNSTILITAQSTAFFSEFREAIGYMQNGGNGWRFTLEKLCVGRECDKGSMLMASLKVNKVSVENPSL